MTDTHDAGPGPDRTPTDDATTTASGDPPPSLGNPIAGQSEDAPLSLEDVFEILRNERRQHVLSYLLLTDDDSVELGDLAEHIAAIENDKPIARLDSQERKRVYVALYQCHLPKMATTDVVDFDKNRGTVEPGRNIEQLDPYLDVPTDDEAEDGTPTRYLLLAAAGLLAYLLAAGLGPSGAVAGGVVAAAGVVAFVAMTVRSNPREATVQEF